MPPFSFLFLSPATGKRKTWLVLIIVYRTSGVVLCYLPLESVSLQAWLFFHTALAWAQCHAVDSANYRSPPSACICFKLDWINMSVPLYKQHTVIFSWFARNKGQEECRLSLFASRLSPVIWIRAKIQILCCDRKISELHIKFRRRIVPFHFPDPISHTVFCLKTPGVTCSSCTINLCSLCNYKIVSVERREEYNQIENNKHTAIFTVKYMYIYIYIIYIYIYLYIYMHTVMSLIRGYNRV